MNTISFIGLGSIGYPIAKHISSKYELYFYARNEVVIQSAKKFGKYVESIENISDKSEILMLFVRDYSQCCECLSKICFERIKYVVIGSTISPNQIRLLQKSFPVKIIDAPVSGGVKGAVDATLTTMISGNSKDLTQIMPIVNTYSKKIIVAGEEIGKAEALKAIVQLMVGINTIASAEAINLARKMNLDLNLTYDTVLNSSGYSKIFENRGKTLISEDYYKRGNMQTMRKDLNILAELSEEYCLNLHLVKKASSLYNIAKESIPEDLDFSAISLMYKDF